MEKIIEIEKVSINESGFLAVKPSNGCFNMIYRSAMGVQWDNINKELYYAYPVLKVDEGKAFRRIVEAVNFEYGVMLKLNSNTVYYSIDDRIKNNICK